MIQEFEKYTEEDKIVWTTLFERQLLNLKYKASDDYMNCLKSMKSVLNANEIPNFNQINDWFKTSTGWKIEVVPGLIPVEDFFKLLAEKKFCSSTWLRTMKQLDYLEEPDMFHDTFGHIPLLANPIFSEFALEFGRIGVANIDDTDFLEQLQRLYWFTIEFGLIKTEKGRRIYGAGLISSFGESISSLSNDVIVTTFDLKKVLNQSFKNDELQNLYFEINNLSELYDAIIKLKQDSLCGK
jgi:phenylalanine-4-hydroxylase